MTRDEIIKLAREADLWLTSDERIAAVERFAALVAAAEREVIESALTNPENQPSQWGTVTIEHMEQQVAAEREACVQVCDDTQRHCSTLAARSMLMEAAAAIRARSHT